MGEITACGLCGNIGLDIVLDLGMQPLAEAMSSTGVFPLQLLECSNCGLNQLSWAADQKELFTYRHPYSTGNSRPLREHYEELADEWSQRLKPGSLAVDIGANDGTFLSFLPAGLHKIAVEPTAQASKIKNTTVYRKFFTRELAELIRETHGPARLVTACNVLAHVPDPHDFMEGVKVLLGDDGFFLTENHDLASIVNGLQIDTIYHEHLRYWSVATLSRLLEMHGFFVDGSIPVSTHGGSFRVIATRAKPDLGHRAEAVAIRLEELVRKCAAEGPVYGVGAATRATPLLHFANLAPYIDCVCEVGGSEKIGTLMPGTDIPVVNEGRLFSDQPSFALLFAWHIADSIVPKLRSPGYRGRFIVPLPEPKVIDD